MIYYDLIKDTKETNPMALANPTAVYSPDRIVNAYGGPVLRIRRDSDNEETNISTKNGVYDIVAHQVFMEDSGYGYVTDLYDQHSGKKHHTFSDVEAEQAFIHYIPQLNDRNYLKFNGTTSYVDCGNPAELNNIWAGGGKISFWMNNNIAVGERILAKENGTAGWAVIAYTSNIVFQHYTSAITGLWSSVGNLSSGWRYVEIEFNTDSIVNTPTVKINGVFVGITTLTSPTGSFDLDSGLVLGIGARIYNNSAYFLGYIADIKIYKSTGLVADYILDEEIGTVATDYLNGNNGVIYYGSWIVEDRHKSQRVIDFDGEPFDSTPNFNQIVLPQSTLLDNIWSGGGIVEADIITRSVDCKFCYKVFQTGTSGTPGWAFRVRNKKLRFVHGTLTGLYGEDSDVSIELNTRYTVKAVFSKDNINNRVQLYINDSLVTSTVTDSGSIAFNDDSVVNFITFGTGKNANSNTDAASDIAIDGSISNVKIYKAGTLVAHYLDSSAKNEAAALTGVCFDAAGNEVVALKADVQNAIAVNCNQAKIKIRNNNVLKFDINDDFYHDYSEITVLRTAQQVQASVVANVSYNIRHNTVFSYSGESYATLGDSSLTLTSSIINIRSAVVYRLATTEAEFSWDSGDILNTLVEQTTTSNIISENGDVKTIDVFDNAVVSTDLTPSTISKASPITINNLIRNNQDIYPSTEYLLSNIVIFNKVLTATEKEAINAWNQKREGQL